MVLGSRHPAWFPRPCSRGARIQPGKAGVTVVMAGTAGGAWIHIWTSSPACVAAAAPRASPSPSGGADARLGDHLPAYSPVRAAVGERLAGSPAG